MKQLFIFGERHSIANRKSENEFLTHLTKRFKTQPVVMLEGLPFGRYKEGKSSLDIFLLKGLKPVVWGIDHPLLLQISAAYSEMVSVTKMVYRLYVSYAKAQERRKKVELLIKALALLKFSKEKILGNLSISSSFNEFMSNVSVPFEKGSNSRFNLRYDRLVPFYMFMSIIKNPRIEDELNRWLTLGIKVNVEERKTLSNIIMGIRVVGDVRNLDYSSSEKILIEVIKGFGELAEFLKSRDSNFFDEFMVRRVTRHLRSVSFAKNIKRIMEKENGKLFVAVIGKNHVEEVVERLKNSNVDIALIRIFEKEALL